MKVTWFINPVLGLWPTVLLIAVALGLIVWDYIRRRGDTSFVTTAGYLVLRVTALAALAVIVLAPVRVIERRLPTGKADKEGPPVIILQDVSQSLMKEQRDALSQAARRLLDAAGIKNAEWIAFAGKPGAQEPKDEIELDPGATDISSALLAAIMYYPPAIVLLSDGAWNKGSDPLVLARDGDFPPIAALFPVVSDTPRAGFAPLGKAAAGEDTPGITVPETVSAGEEFPVKVRFHPGGAGGRMVVRLRGPLRGEPTEEIPVAMEKRLSSSGGSGVERSRPGLEERIVRLVASAPGTWLLEAELKPEGAIAPDSVLTQTAVLVAKSGPLMVLLFQAGIGWDAAAILRILGSAKECRFRRIRGYTETIEAHGVERSRPPEPGEFDVIILCGYPKKEIPSTWKAALVSYLDANKGVMVVCRAAEYLAWRALCAKLPKMFAAPSDGLMETKPDTAALSHEAAVLLEHEAFVAPQASSLKPQVYYGRVSQSEKISLVEAATPVMVGKKTGSVYSTLAGSGGARVLWFGEPPFSGIFGRTGVENTRLRGDVQGLFLDAAYFLAHRKRYADVLRLEVLHPNASPGETVPLVLEGLDAPNVAGLSMTIHGPAGDTFRSFDVDGLQRGITADERFHIRQRLNDPGLYVFGITATYRDGRILKAGAACLVMSQDREKAERGVRRRFLERLAAESKGASAPVRSAGVRESSLLDFTPPEDMVELLRGAASAGPVPVAGETFDLYRWWPLLLVLVTALFAEWALRTR